MHYGNGFELLIAVVFSMILQLVVLGPKAQDFVIPFCLVEEEYLPDFYLRSISIISELVLMRDQIGQINNLIGNYIMEMSNMKHIQR